MHWWKAEMVKPALIEGESVDVLAWDGTQVHICKWYGLAGWTSGGSFHVPVTHWADMPKGPEEVENET